MTKTEYVERVAQTKRDIAALFKQGSEALDGWFSEMLTERFGGAEVYCPKFRKVGILKISSGVITFEYKVKTKSGDKSFTGKAFAQIYDAREWLLHEYYKEDLNWIENLIASSFRPVPKEEPAHAEEGTVTV